MPHTSVHAPAYDRPLLILILEGGEKECFGMVSERSGVPKTIRDRFGFCRRDLDGISVCPMRRAPGARDPAAVHV
jgi:hypothetical protein